MLSQKSLREQVYDYLRRELHSGNLVPGSSINLNEVSRLLGVSKTPLRDALLQLEVEGFVNFWPRCGVFVNRLTLDAIRHCYEMLGALEIAVIISYFNGIDGNRIARMKWINAGLRDAVVREDFDALYELNLAFHNVFLDLSDNMVLRRAIDVGKQRLYDFPRRGYITQWEMRNCDEHDQLIEALEKHDLNCAISVWLEGHWSFKVQEDFIRQFYFQDEPGEAGAALGASEGNGCATDMPAKATKRRRKGVSSAKMVRRRVS
ncbi:MAG: GntR family transcriptional regulator [Syntrophobacteraceae bacterium]